MNRRKKLNSILTKRAKRASAKRAPDTGKPRYISKAERAVMDAQEQEVDSSAAESSAS